MYTLASTGLLITNFMSPPENITVLACSSEFGRLPVPIINASPGPKTGSLGSARLSPPIPILSKPGLPTDKLPPVD